MFSRKDIGNNRMSREKNSTRNMFKHPFWIGLATILAMLTALFLVGCDTPQISITTNGGGATTTHQDTVTASLTTLTQLFVCDRTGSVVVHASNEVNTVTITSKKVVHSTDTNTVTQRLQGLNVNVQSIPSSACGWLPKSGNTSTLVVNAASPDDNNFLKGNKDEIQLDIAIPASLVANSTSVTTRIEAGNNIELNGFGGGLNLLSKSGNITMENVFLSASSTIQSQGGNIAFSGSLRGDSIQHEFHSIAGNIDITFPADTNITLDASAPTGRVNDAFGSSDIIQQTAAGEWYKGPLNPGVKTLASIQLKLVADTGNVVIGKS